MGVTKESFGVTCKGDKVTLYKITNANGLVAEVIDFGAILKALYVPDKNGENADLKIPVKDEEYEYNARYIEHILMIHEIASHADRKDPVSLRSCFINYLKLCEQNGFKVGNLAAYTAMGIDHYTIQRWRKSDKPEYKELANFVTSTCALFREGTIADGKINPLIGIFWQRNYDGLRNDTEQIQAAQETDSDSDHMTAADYRKKYGKLTED